MIQWMLLVLCRGSLSRLKELMKVLGVDGMATLYDAFTGEHDLLRDVFEIVCHSDFAKLAKLVSRCGGPLSLFSVCSNIDRSNVIGVLQGLESGGTGLVPLGTLQLLCVDVGSGDGPMVVMLNRNPPVQPDEPQDPRFPGHGHSLKDEHAAEEGVRALAETAQVVLPDAAQLVEELTTLGLVSVAHVLWTWIEGIRRMLEQDQRTVFQHKPLIEKLLGELRERVAQTRKIVPRLRRPLGICSTSLDSIALTLVALETCSKGGTLLEGILPLKERHRQLHRRLLRVLTSTELSLEVVREAIAIVDEIEVLEGECELFVLAAPEQYATLITFPAQAITTCTQLKPTILQLLALYDQHGFKNAARLLLRLFNELSAALKKPHAQILEQYEGVNGMLLALGALATKWPTLSSQLPSCILGCTQNLQICNSKVKTVRSLCQTATTLKIGLPEGLHDEWQGWVHVYDLGPLLSLSAIDVSPALIEIEVLDRRCTKLIQICDEDIQLLSHSNDHTLFELRKAFSLYERCMPRNGHLLQLLDELGLVELARVLRDLWEEAEDCLEGTVTIIDLGESIPQKLTGWSGCLDELDQFEVAFVKSWKPLLDALGEVQEWLDAFEEYLDLDRYNLKGRQGYLKLFAELKEAHALLDKQIQRLLKGTDPKRILVGIGELLNACLQLSRRIREVGEEVHDKAWETPTQQKANALPTIKRSALPTNAVTGWMTKQALKEVKKDTQGINAVRLCFQGRITNARTGYVVGVFHWHVFGNAQSNMIFMGTTVLGFVFGHIARENPSNVAKADRVERRRNGQLIEVAIINGVLHRIT